MGRAMLLRVWCVSVLALVSWLGCGGSTAAQRTDDGNTDAVAQGSGDDVGDGASTDHQDGTTDPGEGGDDPTDGMFVAAGAVQAGDGDGDGGGGGGTTAPPAAPVDKRFEPTVPRDKMSEFLDKPAAEALKKDDYPLAVSLYSGLVAARGKGDKSAIELAKAWNLAQQYDEAVRVYEEFAAATTDAKARAHALSEVKRLRDSDTPFQREFRAKYAKSYAVDAFKRGRKEQQKKKWADALVYFKMASAIDPTLNGPVREIGTSYGRLGATEEKVRFLLDYLWRSPMGAFSKEVRAELKKMKRTKELGTLTVDSKLPCDELWVVGQAVKEKLPIKKLSMAPGNYKWLCFSPKYLMAYFEQVNVEAGKDAKLEFHWAVIVNKLEKPWGRIAIQNARDTEVMMDLGLESEELGILVPKDGSALKMQLRGPNGALVEERFVRIPAGSKHVVTWKK